MHILLSVMVGIATGLALGILFAPDKGSETRRIISEKSGELKDELVNRFHQFGDFISEKLDSTKGVYKDFIRIGKTSV